MKNLAFLAFTLISLNAFSQDNLFLQNQIDSLKKMKSDYETKIQLNDMKIKEIEDLKMASKFENIISVDYLVPQQTKIKIREQDNASAKIIYEPKRGEKLKLIDFNENGAYWTVSYNNNIGYVNEIYIQNNPSLDEFKKSLQLKKAQVESELKIKGNKAMAKQEYSHRDYLIKRYGLENAERILYDKPYWIGMSDETAKELVGIPDNINRTVGSWGTHEQWVYEKRNLYLYFENGTLSSYQN